MIMIASTHTPSKQKGSRKKGKKERKKERKKKEYRVVKFHLSLSIIISYHDVGGGLGL